VFDKLTSYASHELLETITDPDTKDGFRAWWSETWDEIADPPVCADKDRKIPGTNVTVQQAWSMQTEGCIAHNVLFSGPTRWSGFFCREGETCELAKVDFDNNADAVAFQHGVNGETNVWVAPSDGVGSFVSQSAPWLTNFCVGTQTCATGDVNGDGRADAIAFHRGSNPIVEVALSTGSGFTKEPTPWSNFFCLDGEVCKVADVDGDGRADLIAFTHGTKGNSVFVAISSGSGATGFGPPEEWSSNFCWSNQTCDVGDVNADGKMDIIAFTRDNPANQVYVALSFAPFFKRFGDPEKWSDFFCQPGEVCRTGDFNGDGTADVIAFNHGLNGQNAAYVAASNQSQYTPPQKAIGFFCQSSEACAVGDVNGDGRTDIIAFTLSSTPTPEAWVSTAFP
jgi:hypothetical protein